MADPHDEEPPEPDELGVAVHLDERDPGRVRQREPERGVQEQRGPEREAGGERDAEAAGQEQRRDRQLPALVGRRERDPRPRRDAERGWA
jgi:hypothetical protein